MIADDDDDVSQKGTIELPLHIELASFKIQIAVAIITLCLPYHLCGQIDPVSPPDRRPLLKIGGFIYLDSSKYGGFSFHLELERAFKRKAYLTSGPRIDYINLKHFFDKNYFFGYELKFYPMYWKTGKPYHGLFVGLEPVYLVQTNINKYSRYGPGGGTFLGYQQIIKDKFSVAFEASMAYIFDLNDDSPKFNDDGKYFYLFLSIKFGIKL